MGIEHGNIRALRPLLAKIARWKYKPSTYEDVGGKAAKLAGRADEATDRAHPRVTLSPRRRHARCGPVRRRTPAYDRRELRDDGEPAALGRAAPAAWPHRDPHPTLRTIGSIDVSGVRARTGHGAKSSRP